MPNTNEIPWKRIAVEGAAIVASILLAFAIDAWWSERQERIEEVEILHGLKQEFQRNRDDLVQSMEIRSDMLLANEDLMVACRSGFWESEKFTLDVALQYLLFPLTLDFGGGVLDALISAGRLEIISNDDLRAKLAGWIAVFGEVRDDEKRDSDFVANIVVSYYLRRHIPVSRGAEFFSDDWPIQSRSIVDDPESVVRLFSDAEFEVLLELRYDALRHTLGELDEALEATQQIIREIEDALLQI